MRKLFFLYIISSSVGQKTMIPMDQAQNDHLKAYGIAYYSLANSINVEWLLNYRGGAFLFDENQLIISECKIRGVSFEKVNASGLVLSLIHI